MSVEHYNKNADEFFNNTVNSSMEELYKKFEKELKEGSAILDLGCGSGRDSKYFLEKGYEVTSVDLSRELAKKASEYIGQEVVVEDMLSMKYEDRFDGIWACASMVHLDEFEIAQVMENCFKALKKGGVIYTSFKYGDQDYEDKGRHFTCFTEGKFHKFMTYRKNYDLLTFATEDVRVGREGEYWLNIIIKPL